MASDTTKGEWNPGKKYRAILSQIQDVLSSGEKRTVRDVYYALESRGHKWEYRYVKRAVKKGRRAGYIDPAQIVDASRTAENVAATGWRDPDHFVEDRVDEVWNDYWEDFWREQESYVEVWLEKQSLASVFAPVCEEYNVRLEATRGDWSDSKVYQASNRLREKIADGKDVRILYFGDYNPSGFHAPVSILDAMGYYGIDLGRDFPGSDDPRYYDAEHGAPFWFTNYDGTFELERKALNTEHIEKFELPENPVPSSSDKDATIKRSFRRYVSDGRDTNVELNALKEFEREFLEELVRDAIEEHVDLEKKREVENRIRERREQLAECIDINRDTLEVADDDE
ncbi:hypothetical protein [Halorubrum lipolyticum]|uniref:Uncharacterized protein n=1 Tax=Halorubrum lipolyticum DSM 21995 TaxID=1227482 RepID=M0NI54_9EURY|nr:hypothetical protein [Halorubrum lipolyticum]EMA57253.1 hypothetical protein C469_16013 [Halorubrum lipolyticum DSM 21995]